MATSPRTCAMVLTALLSIGSAAAQQPAPAGGRVSSSDAGFLEQAAQNGHAEVEASKLALEKSRNADVRSFAEKMVAEHTKMHHELGDLAGRKGVKLPDGPSLVQKAQAKMLSGKEGAEFDRDYAAKIGVRAHEETVELFRKASSDTRDADVQALARKSLPALQQHLQLARDLNAKVGAEKAGSSSGSSSAR